MSMTPEKRSQAHPALGYDCPFCGAPAGEGCHTKTGALRGQLHIRRRRPVLAAA